MKRPRRPQKVPHCFLTDADPSLRDPEVSQAMLGYIYKLESYIDEFEARDHSGVQPLTARKEGR